MVRVVVPVPDVTLYEAVSDVIHKQKKQTEINKMIVKGILSGEISFHGSDSIIKILNEADGTDSKDK